MLIRIVLFSLLQFCHLHSFEVSSVANKIINKKIVAQLEALTGGLSSPGVYKFKDGNKKYVLRFSHPGRSILERKKTTTHYKLAAENDIAPLVICADEEKGIIISEYAGNYLSKINLRNNNLLIVLAETLCKLHNLSNFSLPTKDIFAIRKSFEKKALLLNSDLVLKSAHYLQLIDKLIRKEAVSLSTTHYDLKPENILFNNKISIIDWEAACLGYPCFDLATIIIFYDLSEKEQDKFLMAYYKRKPTVAEKKRIELFKKEVLGYYGMAYLMLSVYKKLPPLPSTTIKNLPKLSSYLKDKFTKKHMLNSYTKAQKLGWILIKELNELM